MRGSLHRSIFEIISKDYKASVVSYETDYILTDVNLHRMYSRCSDDQRAGFQKRIKQLETQLEEEESERQSAHKQRKEAELKLNVTSIFLTSNHTC